MAPRQSDEPADKSGAMTGEELAALVHFTPAALQGAGGATLSLENAAQRLLSTRMATWRLDQGDQIDMIASTLQNETKTALARLIVGALPENARTEAVLSQIDLRPILATLAEQGGAELRFDREDGITSAKATTYKINASAFTTMLEQEDERVRTDFGAFAEGSTASPEEKQALVAEFTTYSNDSVDLMPALKPNAQAVAQGTTSPDLLSAGQDALGGQGLFPVDGLTEALQSGMMDFENLVSEEAAQSAELGGGFYPMNLGPDGNTSISGGPGGNSIDRGQAPPQQYAGPTQMMSAAKAKNWLQTLSEKEVANLQMKMAAAGYFDRVDGGAAYIEGDAFDPITMKAWTMLLTETAQQKEAMPMVLARNMRDYRAKRQQANMRQLNEFDATMSRVQANDFSKSVIGRGLSSTEAQALEEFLLGLREQRSGYVAGAVNPAGQLPNADGYDNRDIESFINRNNGDEQMSNYQGELLYTMNKRFGG